ncbi:substrate-binding domain-containing protein (plasmid) [Sinorhizobium meliloti]|nr:substrate-binding domain-containing protein [Sinorhizobium meliloti]
MTVDADLAAEDSALRQTYLGTDNYLMGYRIAIHQEGPSPMAAKICTIEGNPGADKHSAPRPGMRDALTGQKGLRNSRAKATGPKWRLPGLTNDRRRQGRTGDDRYPCRQSRPRCFRDHGRVAAVRGAPQPYRDLFRPMADKIAKNEFVIGAADTIGEEVAIAREGLVTALVGQRPFEMGYKAPQVMLDLIAGKPVEDPVFTGASDECTKETADTCIQEIDSRVEAGSQPRAAPQVCRPSNSCSDLPVRVRANRLDVVDLHFGPVGETVAGVPAMPPTGQVDEHVHRVVHVGRRIGAAIAASSKYQTISSSVQSTPYVESRSHLATFTGILDARPRSRFRWNAPWR